MVVRFEYLKFRLLQKTYFTPDNTTDYGYLRSDQLAGSEAMESNRKAWKKKLNTPKPAVIRAIERNYSKHYLGKIVKLAKESNCRVLFFYLPESGSGLKEPLNKHFYETLAPIITLPDSIINKPGNWKDPMHFNDNGAKKASQFIIPVIENELEKLSSAGKTVNR